MDHLTDEQLADLAMGEALRDPDAGPDPSVHAAQAGHLRQCERCAAEVAAYRHVIGLAHEARIDSVPTPVGGWSAIAQELGFLRSVDGPAPAAPAPVPSRPGPAPVAGRRGRRWWWPAAAAVALLAAAGGGILIGRATMPPSRAVASTISATLTPLPGDTAASTGSATITVGPQGETMTVSTHQLPLRPGFYQVWLYDPSANKMVPIGTLDGRGLGTFTVTPSIDIQAYNIVDVSAQELNGDPAHGTSVLRGTLTH